MAEQQLDLLDPHAPDSRFVVRQSARARHMALTVAAHGVIEVVVPRHTRPRVVEQFVRQHRVWIDRTLADLEKTCPPIDRSMPDVVELPAIGMHCVIRYDTERFRAGTNIVEIPAPRIDRPKCRPYLHRWLKDSARVHLVPRLEQVSRTTGLPFKRVQVRGQRTRWGSCSSSGTLSINFCLLFLNPELVDHVFVHELCHTRVMNHSRRFWRLVREHQPNFRDLEKRVDAAWVDVPGWVGLH